MPWHGDAVARGQPLLGALPPCAAHRSSSQRWPCTPGREHSTRCHAHGPAAGRESRVPWGNGARAAHHRHQGGPAELEMCSPSGAWNKHPGPQRESPQHQAGRARPHWASLVPRLRIQHGDHHRWPPQPSHPAVPGSRRALRWESGRGGRCSRAGLGRRGMQEEVVALRHRWPLPQQHQLCGRASGDWRGAWGGQHRAQAGCHPCPRMPLREATEVAAPGAGWDAGGSELEPLLSLHRPSAATATMAPGTQGTPRRPCTAPGHEEHRAGPAWPGTPLHDQGWGAPHQPCIAPGTQGCPRSGSAGPWREGRGVHWQRGRVPSDPMPRECSPWSLPMPRDGPQPPRVGPAHQA